jgi:uncharacterized protein YbjT (DUF2867 family)
MILLTGSTGSIGLSLAKLLSQRGIPYRGMVRDVAKASALGLVGAEWVQGDFQDPASLRPALGLVWD